MARTEEQKARLHELADFIERAEFEFEMNQSTVNLSCDTAGCIAGHAAVLWPHLRATDPALPNSTERFSWSSKRISEWLGLDPDEYMELFYWAPGHEGEDLELDEVDRAMAVAAIRRFAETGRIIFDPGERQDP